MSIYNSNFQVMGIADDGEPDLIYYNAEIINSNVSNPLQAGQDPVVRFLETRSVPLIKDISKYNFSIIRFTMSGPNKDLPVFLPSVQIGQNDIDLTVYSVGLSLTKEILIGGNPFTFTGYSQRYVRYRTETEPYINGTLPYPNPPLTNQDIRGVYYFVYTYNQWVNLVNETIELALNDPSLVPDAYNPNLSLQVQFNAFWTANGGVGVAPSIITEAPYITWHPETKLFDIKADTYGFGGNDALSFGSGAGGNEEAMDLYFNSNLFGLFSNFENIFEGNDAIGRTNKIIFKNKLGQNIYFRTLPAPSATPPTYNATKSWWVNLQDYGSTSSLWSPISSIVFTSTLIPIYSENVGAPLVYGSGNDVVQSSSTNAFQPIITDIALPLNSADDYRQFIEYVPSAEYRLSSFTRSKQDLKAIDVQVYWKSRLDTNLYPIRMFNLSSVSIKLMFRKKK